MRGSAQIALALLLALFAHAAGAQVLVGRVTKVVDGDTLHVTLASGPIKVRLHGVDTPERNQPWGTEAREWLETQVQGMEVALEPISQDRWDRLIARVFVGELDVNAELVRLGHAWAYRKYMRKGEDAGLCSLEEQARKSRLGLWAISTQDRVAPWDWRRRKQQTPADYSGETIAHCVAAIGT